MTGIEALLAYLISLAASLRGSAIEESRRNKLLEKLEAEAAFFQNVEAMRPLCEEIHRVGINIVRVKAELGVTENEQAIFSLVEDPVFRDDLSNWILSENADDEAQHRKSLSKHFLRALQAADLPPDDVERFQQGFLELTERQVFSNQILSNWRTSIRLRAVQAQVADEGKATRDTIAEAVTQVSEVVKTHVGVLIQTTADDIEKLRRISDMNVESIGRLSAIRSDGADIKIVRDVVASLVDAALNASTLVVGEPGSGKSISLRDLAVALRCRGHEVILLDVQRIESGSLGNLRNELDLAHDLLAVFEDWPGREPAFLLIDALDAARSDLAGGMIRSLITEIDRLDRWNVIATVRKFDLRYADEIRRLFSGPPTNESFADPEFADLRHIHVPLFGDDELAEIEGRSEALAQLLRSANDKLHDLLRVPFNMRLSAELLEAGAGVAELTPIRTQLELLDRYWRARVIRSDGAGDGREAIAFQTAQAMVDRRSLTVPRNAVSRDPSASEPLNELLSSNVLAEWTPPGAISTDRYTLTFSHNILFDFTAELALFRGQTELLIEQLSAEPDLVLAIRPSAVFHFQRLWSESTGHDRFWATTLAATQDEGLPQISQLIGPTVAVELARDIADFEPLFHALSSSDSQQAEAAARVVRHIAGALLASNVELVGETAGPWCAWMERLSTCLDDRIAGSLRALLWRCLDA